MIERLGLKAFAGQSFGESGESWEVEGFTTDVGVECDASTPPRCVRAEVRVRAQANLRASCGGTRTRRARPVRTTRGRAPRPRVHRADATRSPTTRRSVSERIAPAATLNARSTRIVSPIATREASILRRAGLCGKPVRDVFLDHHDEAFGRIGPFARAESSAASRCCRGDCPRRTTARPPPKASKS